MTDHYDLDQCIEQSWNHYHNAKGLLAALAEEKDRLDSLNALVLVIGAATEALLGKLVINIPINDFGEH